MKICEPIVYASILLLMIIIVPFTSFASTNLVYISASNRTESRESVSHMEVSQSSPSREPFGFEATRYGLKLDLCPNGARPEFTPLGNVKWCHASFECSFSYECVNIIGLNHFGTQVRYCCPTRTTICTVKPLLSRRIEVNCIRRLPAVPIYYFDVDKLRCVQARVPECVTEDGTTITLGNRELTDNRFISLGECRTNAKLLFAACELGESILLRHHNFDQPFLCQLDEDCPSGYNCRQDKLFHRGVCCGYMTFEPCPLGFKSFIVPFTGRPKTCFKNQLRDECPTDYVCAQNDANQLHYCCTLDSGVCPPSQQPYIHPLTDRTIKCNPNSYEAACPRGYACSARIYGSYWGFCCSLTVSNANCPVGSTPLLNHATNLPQKCQEDTCGPGYYCQKNQRSQYEQGFCCLRIKPEQTLVPRSRLLKLTTSSTTTINSSPRTPLSGELEPFTPTSETPLATSTTIGSMEHGNSEEEGGEEDQERGLETHEKQQVEDNQQSNELSQSAEGKEESSVQAEIDWAELESEIDQILAKKTSEFEKRRRKRKLTPKRVNTAKEKKEEEKGRSKVGSGVGTSALRCPRNYKPISYPGTDFQLHCSQEEVEEGTSSCPESSMCLYAVGDRLARSLCCAPIRVRITTQSTSKESPSGEQNSIEEIRVTGSRAEEDDDQSRNTIYSSGQTEEDRKEREKALL